MPRGAPYVKIDIRAEPEVIARLDRIALASGEPLSVALRAAIRAGLPLIEQRWGLGEAPLTLENAARRLDLQIRRLHE